MILISEYFAGVPWLERVYQAANLWDAAEMARRGRRALLHAGRVRAQEGSLPVVRAVAEYGVDLIAPELGSTARGQVASGGRRRSIAARGAADPGATCLSPPPAPGRRVRGRPLHLRAPRDRFREEERLPEAAQDVHEEYHVKGAAADPDKDGLTNLTEYRAHTNPKKKDTDKDGVADGSEDYDHDGLDNATEQRAGTNPGLKDTDHDGKPDAREDADHDGLNNLAEQNTANDPGDPDSDDDGVERRRRERRAGRGVQRVGADAAPGVDRQGRQGAASTTRRPSSATATEDYEAATTTASADDTSARRLATTRSRTTRSTTTRDDTSDDDDDASDDVAATTTPTPPPRASCARRTRRDDTSSDYVRRRRRRLRRRRAASDDSCLDTLDAGAWVHESTLSTDDDGARSSTRSRWSTTASRSCYNKLGDGSRCALDARPGAAPSSLRRSDAAGLVDISEADQWLVAHGGAPRGRSRAAVPRRGAVRAGRATSYPRRHGASRSGRTSRARGATSARSAWRRRWPSSRTRMRST